MFAVGKNVSQEHKVLKLYALTATTNPVASSTLKPRRWGLILGIGTLGLNSNKASFRLSGFRVYLLRFWWKLFLEVSLELGVCMA